ncbi:FAD-dependent oxidoreductase [Zobellia amurskyensis]|uniref:FAD-dependent oxidoreductase n=1 Tax=Zobellia amurskyensis TaxID=248905 RepID=A0A7X3D004_9FLAO|nr:FAD-dependent oxidoreductase [Zobellia amurskyensis]MUH34576.1 FAD-dependent oxidoreductase [Zobellia amurskyensis]
MNKRRGFLKKLGVSSGAMALGGPITTLFANSNTGFPLDGEEEIKTLEFLTKTKAYEKVQYNVDVCIVGGGMSGICAAIAAARNGSKVLLMQDRSRLGGNASSEIRMHISGASQLKQVWRETGILEELVLTEAVTNPQRSYEMWDFVLYDKIVSEPNITLLLDTSFYDVEVSNGKIKKVWGLCSPTEEISEITATYFSDCTGDGSIAAKAGANYMRGREAKSTFNESLAVDVADQKTMGNSLLFMAQPHEKAMPYTPPVWARKYTTKDFVHRNIGSYEYGYWWLELGGSIDIVRDGQQNRHDLLATLFGVWDYIKNSGNHPESENWALSWVGMIPGKRESRRIEGPYIMKQQDVQAATLFEDRVAYGGWPLDDHPPGGMDTTGDVPYVSIPLKEPYSIPFRSLYSNSISNLLFAGRNISVSHVALSSTRVMATCALLGQAIGTAMAYCLNKKITPQKLTASTDEIKGLQQLLLKQDQGILGVQNEDEDDLARAAKVKSSSQTKNGKDTNIIDGINRDIADGKVHQWQASMKQGEQWISLNWKKPVTVNTVQLTFDTGLNRFLRMSPQDWVYNDQVRGPQPETIADYSIEVETASGNKKVVAEVNDNYLRLAKHTFGQEAIKSMRIRVSRTNGDDLARLFEVRCYLEKMT